MIEQAECKCDRLQVCEAALLDANAEIELLRAQVERLREALGEKNRQAIERLTKP